MTIFLLSFVVIAIALLGMGVGVLWGKTNIKGSCGGLNTLGRFGVDCTACAKPCDPANDKKAIDQPLGQHSGTEGVCLKATVFSRRSRTRRPYGTKTNR